MSLRLSAAHSARWILRTDTCSLCSNRGPQLVRRYATPRRLDPRKGTPQEIRTDIDKRNRHAFYRMLFADRLLPCKLQDTNKIIDQFVINEKSGMDPATNVRQLAQRYNIRVIHLPMLAIPLFRIPDVNDTKAQLPPSQQSIIAASLLLACSAAGDLQATLQILNAVYYSSNGYNVPHAAKIARLFSPTDLSNCRKVLQQLAEGNDGKAAATGDANAMTLHGKFLELAGKQEEARYLYGKALEKYETKFFREYPHPMALPWLKPWTELVSLEETSATPSSERITEALKFGALKADDPIAYYKLAALEEHRSPEWLTYMSKAAASGHSEAMYTLGQFYLHANEQPSVSFQDTGFRKVTRFLTSWKPNATAKFGMEWLKAAGMGGHKPALMEMAQIHEKQGAKEEVKSCLRAVLNEPINGGKEPWPQLVMQARQRLATL